MYKNASPNNIELLRKLSPIMDFSNFSEDHELFSSERKAVPSFFKDESKDKVVFVEIVAPKPKLYRILSISKEEYETNGGDGYESIIRNKGVPKNVANLIEHAEYKKCVEEETKLYKEFKRIKMTNFTLTTEKVRKLCLSSGDTKRWWSCSQHSKFIPFFSSNFPCNLIIND